MDARHLNLVSIKPSYYWFKTARDIRTREIVYFSIDTDTWQEHDLAWTTSLYDGIH